MQYKWYFIKKEIFWIPFFFNFISCSFLQGIQTYLKVLWLNLYKHSVIAVYRSLNVSLSLWFYVFKLFQVHCYIVLHCSWTTNACLTVTRATRDYVLYNFSLWIYRYCVLVFSGSQLELILVDNSTLSVPEKLP